ncbi:flagellar basal body-associated FliL family protein [bacterium]|nr:flagellar basal body-associated FliL family protein [bacterium]
MAEEENNNPEGQQAEEATAQKPKKGLNLASIGMMVQAVVMLAMVGLIAKVVFMSPKPDLSGKTLGERIIASVRDESEDIQHMSLDQLVVNIDNEHTLKAQLVLELSDSDILKAFESRTPIIRSKILKILSLQKFANMDKIQGKLELKDLLVQLLNEELSKTSYKGKGTVRDIYFTDLVLI